MSKTNHAVHAGAYLAVAIAAVVGLSAHDAKTVAKPSPTPVVIYTPTRTPVEPSVTPSPRSQYNSTYTSTPTPSSKVVK
jgi:hypothetical protein